MHTNRARHAARSRATHAFVSSLARSAARAHHGPRACASPTAPPLDAGSDAASPADAASPTDALPIFDSALATDTGAPPRVTYEDIQPLLEAHCAPCHVDGESLPWFVGSYAVMQQPSTLCEGDVVGTCVGLAVESQTPEGTRCRTIVTRPFHREGWTCLDDAQRAQILAWVAGGMLER